MSETTTIAQALLAFQAEAPALQRDKINPHLNSKYLSLEALLEEVLPLLNEHGLVVSQWPTWVETEKGDTLPALHTRLVHAESGDEWTGTMLIFPTKTDPPGQGSAITYAKRYSLMGALGLSADSDTDGAAQGRTRRPRGTSATGKITAPQRNELMAAVREAKIPTDRASEIIKEVADVDKSTEIPAAKFADVLKAIRAAK